MGIRQPYTYLSYDDICGTCGKRGGEHYTPASVISYCDPLSHQKPTTNRMWTWPQDNTDPTLQTRHAAALKMVATQEKQLDEMRKQLAEQSQFIFDRGKDLGDMMVRFETIIDAYRRLASIETDSNNRLMLDTQVSILDNARRYVLFNDDPQLARLVESLAQKLHEGQA